MDKKGSTLVLLVIVIAIVIVLGFSALNIVLKQYEIKRFNTTEKQAFSMSETGLNEAYVRACGLIDESVTKSIYLAEEYLEFNPENINEAKNIFITNYKLNITNNIKKETESSGNPKVEVRSSSITFTGNEVKVLLKSTYTTNNSAEKITWVELLICIPEYELIENNSYNVKNYIKFANWSS